MATIKLTDQEKQELESAGYYGTVAIGGPAQQRYWRPDGQVVFMIPAIRQSVVVKDGKKIPIGTRDANYDKGYLPAPPLSTMLQLTCPHCTMWHKTQAEIDACSSVRNSFIAGFEREAMEEVVKEKMEEAIKDVGVKVQGGNPVDDRIVRLEKM